MLIFVILSQNSLFWKGFLKNTKLKVDFDKYLQLKPSLFTFSVLFSTLSPQRQPVTMNCAFFQSACVKYINVCVVKYINIYGSLFLNTFRSRSYFSCFIFISLYDCFTVFPNLFDGYINFHFFAITGKNLIYRNFVCLPFMIFSSTSSFLLLLLWRFVLF